MAYVAKMPQSRPNPPASHIRDELVNDRAGSHTDWHVGSFELLTTVNLQLGSCRPITSHVVDAFTYHSGYQQPTLPVMRRQDHVSAFALHRLCHGGGHGSRHTLRFCGLERWSR